MNILETVENARKEQKLLDSTARNLTEWYRGGFLPEWARASIEELVTNGEFSELNDRFYQYMAFGTGGMRGRTIGGVVTSQEKGALDSGGEPAHPANGSHTLNDFNVIR